MSIRVRLLSIMYTIEPLTFLVINSKRLIHAKHRKWLRSIILTISQKTGKPKAKIYWDMFIKCFCACALYTDYSFLNLYERPLREMNLYFTHGRFRRVMPYMKSLKTRALFANKPAFNQVFARYIKRDWLYISEKTTLHEFESFIQKHQIFVAKPVNLNQGSGIWLVDSSEYSSSDVLYNLLIEKDTRLIEERIFNHKELDKFSSTSLNTVRIITLKLPEGVKIIRAFLKFNLSGSIADNVKHLSYSCPIDFETGTIIGNIKDQSTKEDFGEYHPSGFRALGMKIPYWNEAIALAKECTLFLDDVYLGPWDIAITDDGPLIIEGNNGPSFSFQVSMNCPLNHDMQRARKYAQKCRKLQKRENRKK